MNVLIIGAGVTGLSIGSALLKAGVGITLLEKGSSVAGLAASFTKDGYTFDLGPHIFFGKKVYSKMEEYFDVDKVIVENRKLKRGIYIHGRIYSYPLQLSEILRRMAWRKWPKVLLEIATARLFGAGNEETVHGWVRGKIGKTLVDYIELDTYVRKLYGISASETSADWGKHRLKPLGNLTLWKALDKAFNPKVKGKRRFTYYPPKGIGEIPREFAAYVTAHGGNIRLDTAVEGLIVKSGRVEGVKVLTDGVKKVLSADFIVSTARITELVRMLEPPPPREVLDGAARLRYRDVIILYLIVARERVLDHCFVYYSTRDTWFKRVTEFKHFSAQMAPQNSTSLAVEICVDPGDPSWEYDDRRIFEVVVEEMERVNILKRQEVTDYFTVKVPAVYPVYYLKYQEHLGCMLDYFAGIKNLVSVGRGGLYQHDNMPTAIASGFDVAGLIAEYGRGKTDEIPATIYRKRLHKYEDTF